MLNKLIINTGVLAIPGFVSIVVSLASIPIHLNIAGPESYGNFIIFHFILLFAVNLNFGIGKSTAISINNYPKYSSKISYKALIYTRNIIFYLFILTLLIYIFDKLFFSYIFKFYGLTNYLIFGSVITILYITFEGIFQGFEKFKLISLFNLIFYSLSFSVPSILLILKEDLSLDQLILISIIFKFLTICLMILYIYLKKLVEKSNNNILYKNLIKNSKWITLNSILIQFYDLFDKYLLKIFLGPISLAIYSIPQQLTGKLSIISKSLSFFLLPNLSRNRSKKEFNLSLEIMMKFFPIILFFLMPFYELLLKFWLGSTFNNNILNLTKIFSISVILSCASHILITEFEASKTLKKNLKIEIILMPFFLFFLFFLISKNYSLIHISLLILSKELILFIMRLSLLKKRIYEVKKYFLLPFIFITFLFLSFFNSYLFYLSIFIFLVYLLNEKLKFRGI